MRYAFAEFYRLLNSMRSPVPGYPSTIHYLCALVSELAYYHVPQFEIDNRKRVKFIPCQGYGEILNSRVPTSVIQYLQESDFQDPFVIEHKGTVTVGLYAKQYLFIGIRGTVFLNDWKINLHLSLSRARRTPCIRAFPHPLRGRAHTGFLKEATRIVTDLMRETHKQNRTKVSHTFFSGHSLGGAVAALTSNLLSKNASSTCIFGAPRYCDSTGYIAFGPRPATHFARRGDLVPSLPPRWLGYADHARQFDTNGIPSASDSLRPGLFDLFRHLPLFCGDILERHSMEGYRQELGGRIGSTDCMEELVPLDRLTVERVS